ncbi:ATP-binding protein [Nocardiopsis dassonvillei]|uniref:ATP-binding protein n=1 Tax=Nocardiopsis dassonvillei TaxID=2014 RepID=UPI0020A4630A|nr:ATP-binding protein [Nocardiopsis dassonvillei]MCP3013856.1 ATP-binding protein [Nocardiopsis dassonvillei]
MPEELKTIRRSLSSLGLEEILPFDEGEEERGHDKLAEEMLYHEPPANLETLVIYCTGHGILKSGRYRLLLSKGGLFDPTALITALEHERWKNLQDVILIIDACQAEPGLDAALTSTRMVGAQTSLLGFWGIGASRRLEQAQQRSFATAFAHAVEQAARPSWTRLHLDPQAIANEVDRTLRRAPGQAVGRKQSVWLANGHPARPCRALPNPHHQNPSPPPPRSLPLPATWAANARGVLSPDLPGFFFVGRTALIEELREQLTSEKDGPTLVVTGSPGVGRSALLGHLVLIIDEDGRRALPGQVTFDGPAPPVSAVAGRGTPEQVTDAVLRRLAPARGAQDLGDVLSSAAKPLALVLDDLDEDTDPEVWKRFFEPLRAVPGVRLVVGLPTSSKIPFPGAATYDLDDRSDESAEDIREYLALQIRLAAPKAPEPQVSKAVDTLVPRVASEWSVATTVSALPRIAPEESSVRRYLNEATTALDAAAYRLSVERVATVLGERAKGIVWALSALCMYDEDIALPDREWAAAASVPGDTPVSVEDITTAARLMRSLVEERPAENGSPRWRARFGYPRGPRHPDPDEFLQRLPQVASPHATNWQDVDPSIQVLVSRAAGLGLLHGRLLDDPVFLLEAPRTVVSRALRQLPGPLEDRTRRARMWSLVPGSASDADRAWTLRVGAERFGVTPVVTAFRSPDRADVEAFRFPAVDIEWVQPNPASPTRVANMRATSSGPFPAVVTVQDDDSLSFWNPPDGRALRSSVTVPGTPRDLTVAALWNGTVALVSTWQRGIWLVPCREDTPPILLPQLVPPLADGGGRARSTPLLLSLHQGGQVVVGSGRTVWIGEVGSGEPVRRLATVDEELLSVHAVGPVDAPVVWLSTVSGHLRRLRLGRAPGENMSPFPLPHRPLAVAVSERSGDLALAVDALGNLHLRGQVQRGDVPTMGRRSETRAAALNDTTMVLGGSNRRSGWLEIHDVASAADPLLLPFDEAVVGIALHEANRVLVARTCGLVSMKLEGRHG